MFESQETSLTIFDSLFSCHCIYNVILCIGQCPRMGPFVVLLFCRDRVCDNGGGHIDHVFEPKTGVCYECYDSNGCSDSSCNSNDPFLDVSRSPVASRPMRSRVESQDLDEIFCALNVETQ